MADENTEYSFPSMREIAQFSLPNESLANISLPLTPALLADKGTGGSIKFKFSFNIFHLLVEYVVYTGFLIDFDRSLYKSYKYTL